MPLHTRTQVFAIAFRGSVEAVNMALSNILYIGKPDWYGQDQVTLFINDYGATGAGEPLNASTTIPILLHPENDAPAVSLEKGDFDGIEDLPLHLPNITVKDVDIGTGALTLQLSTARERSALIVPNLSYFVEVSGNETNFLSLKGNMTGVSWF